MEYFTSFFQYCLVFLGRPAGSRHVSRADPEYQAPGKKKKVVSLIKTCISAYVFLYQRILGNPISGRKLIFSRFIIWHATIAQ